MRKCEIPVVVPASCTCAFYSTKTPSISKLFFMMENVQILLRFR